MLSTPQTLYRLTSEVSSPSPTLHHPSGTDRARQSIGKKRNKSRMKTSKRGIPIIILLKWGQEKMQALHQKHILFPLLLPTFRMISSFGSNLQNPYIQKMFPKLNYKLINQIESCLQSGILDNLSNFLSSHLKATVFSSSHKNQVRCRQNYLHKDLVCFVLENRDSLGIYCPKCSQM